MASPGDSERALDFLFHGSGIVMVKVSRSPRRTSTGDRSWLKLRSGELSTRVVAGLDHSAGTMGSPAGFWYVGALIDRSPHRASSSSLSADLVRGGLDDRNELRPGAMAHRERPPSSPKSGIRQQRCETRSVRVDMGGKRTGRRKQWRRLTQSSCNEVKFQLQAMVDVEVEGSTRHKTYKVRRQRVSTDIDYGM